ncbi:cache domain-containing protein [Arenimonas sp.]|nr:cache domain-containing protein [Candidatus Parcubacteria bacterium]
MKHKKTVYITLTFTVTCILIYACFLTTSIVKKNIKDNLIIEYGKQEHLIALQLAQILELELSQRQAELKLIATLPEVMSGDTATCNKKLKEIFQDKNNKLGNYGRVDKDGYFKCSLNDKLIGLKGETLGTYIKDIFEDPEHKPVMSRAIKPVGADGYLIAIHVPVFDEKGNFSGTVGGAIYLKDLKDKYMKDVEITNGGSIAIYDDDGTVIHHYKPELIGTNFINPDFQKRVSNTTKTPNKTLKEIKDGVSGTRTYVFDNEEVIASYDPIHIFMGRNWRIVVNLPTSTVNANIIKIGADKVLSGIPITFTIIILLFYSIFLWYIKRKV